MKLLGGTSPAYCKALIGGIFWNSESPSCFAPLQINSPTTAPQKCCITAGRWDKAEPACCFEVQRGPASASWAALVLPASPSQVKTSGCHKQAAEKHVYFKKYICLHMCMERDQEGCAQWCSYFSVFAHLQFLISFNIMYNFCYKSYFHFKRGGED